MGNDLCTGRYIIFSVVWSGSGFLFSSVHTISRACILSPLVILVHTVPPITGSEIEVFNGDGGSHMRSIGSSYFSASSLGGISTYAREVVNTTIALHGSFSLPFLPLLPTNLR